LLPISNLVYDSRELELPPNVTNVTKVTKPIKSTRETQFWETEECQNIKPNHIKEDVLQWIKENQGYSRKQLYDKFGVGSIKFEMELAKEKLI
jgi:hypothetical protein